MNSSVFLRGLILLGLIFEALGCDDSGGGKELEDRPAAGQDQPGGVRGESEAGEVIVAGEMGGSEGGFAGSEAGEVPSGEQASLRCVEGEVLGPLSESTVVDLMSEPVTSQAHGELFGHHRRFSRRRAPTKQELAEASEQLRQNINAYNLHEVLSVFHGSPPSGWRPIEPLGGGFWLAAASSIAHQEGLYYLDVEDKWDHALPPLKSEGALSASEPIIGRFSLWASDREDLNRLRKHPLLKALLDARVDVLPPLADRSLTVGLEHSLQKSGGVVLKVPSLRWTSPPISLSRSSWRSVANHPRVIWVGLPEVLPRVLNAPSRDLMLTDEVTQPHFTRAQVMPDYQGWTGRGVRVGIMDSGVALHPDFFEYSPTGEVLRDRVRGELPPSNEDGHGTTVAGILAGNGFASAGGFDIWGRANSPFQWRGQAPEVLEIFSHLMFGTGNASEAPAWTQIFDDHRAHLSNHSHTFGNGFYTSEIQGYDAFISGIRISEEEREAGGLVESQTFSSPPRPAFLSAGNNGLTPLDSIFMRLHGYYGLLVNLKDALIIGSVNSNDAQHVDWSSMGPTLDGRIKPDLMAPGSSDLRPLGGYTLELGEVRLHARQGSGNQDLSWRWGRPHFQHSPWTGQGGLAPEESSLSSGILSGFSFGSYNTRIQWDRAEGEPVIRADEYEAISVEIRFVVSEDGSIYDSVTPPDRIPLNIHHSTPPAWMLRWGDDQGRGYDVTRYLKMTEEVQAGEWTRIKYTFDRDWGGEISRLRVTPAIYWGGVYTPSMFGGYEIISGTSMAAPAAAGIGALALEQLTTEHDYDLETSPPSPALLRGLMTHTARDLSRPLPPQRASDSPDTGMPAIYYEGPDFTTGFGLIDASALSRLISAGAEAPRWIEGEISSGEIQEITLNVRGGAPLRVTLTWDDPPGSLITPSWERKLIHDLDLAVLSPLGEAHGPWILTPPPLKLENLTSGVDELRPEDITPARRCVTPSLMELWTEEEQETPQEVELTEEVVFAPRGNQRCIDDLNTNEQVYIAAPISGPYTLLVRGAKSGGSSQKYVLIWSQSCSLGDDHTMNVEANTSDRSE